MNKNWNDKLADRLDGLLEHLSGFILVIIAVVTVLGLITGYRYYSYTQDEPQYCASCHLMQEAFSEWQKGRHSNVVCQQCHRLTILEQNKLLVAYVLKGNKPLAQTHGREKPWEACKDCHAYEMSQGSLTLEKSFGHARHAIIQKTQCKVCHKITTHNFRPNESACGKCHKDKGVHGIKTEAFTCLACHTFSHKKKPALPTSECLTCHRGTASKGVMAALTCLQCHKPHERKKVGDATCTIECHRNEAAVGRHGFHMKKGLECAYCHKPHTWKVAGNAAVCGKCHAFRKPETFIY